MDVVVHPRERVLEPEVEALLPDVRRGVEVGPKGSGEAAQREVIREGRPLLLDPLSLPEEPLVVRVRGAADMAYVRLEGLRGEHAGLDLLGEVLENFLSRNRYTGNES